MELVAVIISIAEIGKHLAKDLSRFWNNNSDERSFKDISGEGEKTRRVGLINPTTIIREELLCGATVVSGAAGALPHAC